MPFRQQVKFNDPPRYTFSVDDFSGGINNVSEIKENEARSLLNTSFTDGLKMPKRVGFKLHSSSTQRSSNVKFINEYKPRLTPNELIIATETHIYSDGNLLTAVSGDVQGTTFNGDFWFVDGTDIFVYDGTNTKILKNPPAGYTPNPTYPGNWNSDATHTWYEPSQPELDDNLLGVNLIPEKPSLITSNKGRLYISGAEEDPNNVYISDLENGYYFAVGLPIQPDPNGEKVTALKIFHDVLIVGRNESLYALYGNSNNPSSSDPFTFRHVNSHTGIYHQNTCQLMHDYMVYLGSDGIAYRMITPLTDVRRITSQVHSRTVDFFAKPISLSKSDMVGACATFYNDEYWLAMGSFIFVYSYKKLAWTIYDHPFEVSYMATIDGELIIGSASGTTYTQKDAVPGLYTDTWSPSDGVTEDKAISCFWSSKRYDLGDPTRYKHFREMFTVTSTYVEYESDVSIKFEIDFIDVDNILTVKDTVAVWGRAKFGDRFINKDIAASIPTQIGRRGRFISFTIGNDIIDQPLEVHEVAGDYILRGRR